MAYNLRHREEGFVYPIPFGTYSVYLENRIPVLYKNTQGAVKGVLIEEDESKELLIFYFSFQRVKGMDADSLKKFSSQDHFYFENLSFGLLAEDWGILQHRIFFDADSYYEFYDTNIWCRSNLAFIHDENGNWDEHATFSPRAIGYAPHRRNEEDYFESAEDYFDEPDLYNDNLDMDQQDPEFWNNL